MKRLFALALAASLVAPIVGCSTDDDDVRSSRTTTRIEPDGDRVSKTTKTTTDSNGNTVKTSKTTTVDR